jgi:thiamine biosynthesis lipoprotein
MISEAKIFKLSFILSGLLLAGCFFKSSDSPAKVIIHELKGDIFGAFYIIKYRGDLDPLVFQKDLDIFFTEFNNEFSTYQSNSVISEFNRAGPDAPLKVSARFIEMLKLSEKIFIESEGAFDPTLGPVVKLWGFGGGKVKRTPSEVELKSARALVGFKQVAWDEAKLTVWKKKAGLELDVNAFAPGWVCDLVGEMLRERGVKNFMVDLSGELLFKGDKGQDGAWVAGIEKPTVNPTKGVQTAFYIHDLSLSTSGSYRQFFTEKGERRSHIIDPRTGRPVTHSISSASVLGPTGAATDAWSTIMMVLGPNGMDLAEKNGMKVLLLDAKNPNLFEEILSPSMSRFIEENRP